jgi:hypothetical protein
VIFLHIESFLIKISKFSEKKPYKLDKQQYFERQISLDIFKRGSGINDPGIYNFLNDGYSFESVFCILHFQAGNHYCVNNNLPEKLPYHLIFSFQEKEQRKSLQISKSRIVHI